jgi:transposase
MVVTEQSGGVRANTLRQENAELREQNRLLQAEVIVLRQQANYHRSQHKRAVQRAQELEAQVEVLKAKVAELQHRLFGRKSERARQATPFGAAGKSGVGPRARGQQPGSGGHGRKLRKNLPVEEVVLDLSEKQRRCSRCGLVWESFGEPQTSEQIEWRVHLVRRRTVRPKYRRPSGCRCEPHLPDIISAPVAPALIPKGILAPSFVTEVLLLKFLYHVPLERIRAMVRSEGLALSAGTLCGVLEKFIPMFSPLYQAIQAQSRQADLCLMDETRWEVFVQEPNKGSHRWWLWVVVTQNTRLYIIAPSRSAAVPKAYFGYDPQGARCKYKPMLVVDRYKAYAFLDELLQLSYCWAHVRRDYLQLRLGAQEDQAWADSWIERIAKLYELNQHRLTLAKSQSCSESLPAPFVELDPQRMSSSEYAQADEALHHALADMEKQSVQELAQNNLSRLRCKVLTSLQAHWPGLTLFADHPQIPMDNNGAERAIRPGAIGRKNYYGSGSRWSAQLLAMMLTLLQTLVLHKINPRNYLTAYLQACALNGSKAPEQLESWLPWNFIHGQHAAGVEGSPCGVLPEVCFQARAP